MEPTGKLSREGVVNHAVALYPGLACEGGGDNFHLKVRLSAGFGAGMAGMAGAFILDNQLKRLQGIRQRLFDSIGGPGC